MTAEWLIFTIGGYILVSLLTAAAMVDFHDWKAPESIVAGTFWPFTILAAFVFCIAKGANQLRSRFFPKGQQLPKARML